MQLIRNPNLLIRTMMAMDCISLAKQIDFLQAPHVWLQLVLATIEICMTFESESEETTLTSSSPPFPSSLPVLFFSIFKVRARMSGNTALMCLIVDLLEANLIGGR